MPRERTIRAAAAEAASKLRAAPYTERMNKRANAGTSKTKTQIKKSTSKPSSVNMAADSPFYFWRETTNGGFMSQWYASPFTDDNDPSILYKTAEHYMMYQKAILFNDAPVGAEVLKAPHPRKAKTLGRKVHNFTSEIWDAERERIVLQANILKFRADPTLREQLLATGERELIEASPYDRIWGIGFTEANAEENKDKWGLNLLGKALMETRRILREERS